MDLRDELAKCDLLPVESHDQVTFNSEPQNGLMDRLRKSITMRVACALVVGGLAMSKPREAHSELITGTLAVLSLLGIGNKVVNELDIASRSDKLMLTQPIEPLDLLSQHYRLDRKKSQMHVIKIDKILHSDQEVFTLVDRRTGEESHIILRYEFRPPEKFQRFERKQPQIEIIFPRVPQGGVVPGEYWEAVFEAAFQRLGFNNFKIEDRSSAKGVDLFSIRDEVYHFVVKELVEEKNLKINERHVAGANGQAVRVNTMVVSFENLQRAFQVGYTKYFEAWGKDFERRAKRGDIKPAFYTRNVGKKTMMMPDGYQTSVQEIAVIGDYALRHNNRIQYDQGTRLKFQDQDSCYSVLVDRHAPWPDYMAPREDYIDPHMIRDPKLKVYPTRCENSSRAPSWFSVLKVLRDMDVDSIYPRNHVRWREGSFSDLFKGQDDWKSGGQLQGEALLKRLAGLLDRVYPLQYGKQTDIEDPQDNLSLTDLENRVFELTFDQELKDREHRLKFSDHERSEKLSSPIEFEVGDQSVLIEERHVRERNFVNKGVRFPLYQEYRFSVGEDRYFVRFIKPLDEKQEVDHEITFSAPYTDQILVRHEGEDFQSEALYRFLNEVVPEFNYFINTEYHLLGTKRFLSGEAKLDFLARVFDRRNEISNIPQVGGDSGIFSGIKGASERWHDFSSPEQLGFLLGGAFIDVSQLTDEEKAFVAQEGVDPEGQVMKQWSRNIERNWKDFRHTMELFSRHLLQGISLAEKGLVIGTPMVKEMVEKGGVLVLDFLKNLRMDLVTFWSLLILNMWSRRRKESIIEADEVARSFSRETMEEEDAAVDILDPQEANEPAPQMSEETGERQSQKTPPLPMGSIPQSV